MKTTGQILLDRVNSQGEDCSVGEIVGHQIRSLSFNEYFSQIEILALGLLKLGFHHENKISILSQTRLTWHLFDAAAMSLRGIVVPIYPSYLPKEVLYILNHSESSFLIIESNEQFEKCLEIQDQIKFLHTIICIDDIRLDLRKKLNPKFSFFTLQDLKEMGQESVEKNPEQFKKEISKQNEKDVATIIYTSGTTGEPKGAVISQEAFTSMLLNIAATFKKDTSKDDRLLTFLPLSHVLGRADSWIPAALGLQAVYAENIQKLIENIAFVKPTIMIAVPRIFEKIYDGIQKKIEDSSFVKKNLFRWAEKKSEIYYSKLEKNLTPTTNEILQEKLAYKLVFSKIYERFGGKFRFFISGGAPLAPDIMRFLNKIHLVVLEGYGLTETIAPCFVNPLRRQVVGSVGLIFPNSEIKIADDGEILIKTTGLFTEYYKNPEATADALKDGWLHTGDIGQLNEDGYLFITDRKKDLIITSGGKNVAPQMIENVMKLERHISHFVVIGDRRKFLTGLVGIEKESFLDIWDELGLSTDCSFEEFTSNQKVVTLIEKEVEKVNKTLARFETIKKVYIVPKPFTPESGLLTPSQKVRKKHLISLYESKIDAMYQEEKL